MDIPNHLKFTKTHEWIRVEGDEVFVGISDFAQSSLGEVVYIDLPHTGDSFSRGEDAAAVESVKAANSIYAPVSGTVTKINEELTSKPELLNKAPWDNYIFALRYTDIAELADLLDAEGYRSLLEQETAQH
ncbi:MAG: glycine cleavage system protein GcvH [Spirochaetales bacterium]|nr:MAG: glycine cleavage system protein GcvH [Spirochaetales bacterium]